MRSVMVRSSRFIDGFSPCECGCEISAFAVSALARVAMDASIEHEFVEIPGADGGFPGRRKDMQREVETPRLDPLEAFQRRPESRRNRSIHFPIMLRDWRAIRPKTREHIGGRGRI